MKSVPLTVALLFLACAGCSGEKSDLPPADPAALSVSGPHVHGNLQMWLVHGPDGPKLARELVTLADALTRGLVKVHETGAVSELAIENTAADADVFVQAGDIVQGGDQDRTIARDLVLAPASGRLPLPSFCVEQGRWSPRGQSAPGSSGQEAANFDFAVAADGGIHGQPATATFAFASNALPTIELKRAIARADQEQVWSEVGHVQCMLATNVSPEVVDRSSPSSLELTLDTDAVRSATDAYVAALGGMFTARDDVVGCVFVIGGRLQSADVYGSRALLRSLWPKLLRAAATAALAAPQDETVSPPAEDAVRAFIAAPAETKVRETRGTVTESVGETGCAQVIESRSGDALLHRVCLAK